MKLTTRQLTLCAVLTAMALALSYLENFFPLSLAIPIPGIKLGLANIVTLFALYALGPGQALLILLARCLLGSVFAGNLNALIFSVLGFKRNIMGALGILILTAVAVAFLALFAALLGGNIAIPLILPFLYYLSFTAFMSAYAAYPIIDRYMIAPYAGGD